MTLTFDQEVMAAVHAADRAARARQRVTHGAEFLDVHRPGWRDRILDTLEAGALDLQNCAHCVVGSLVAAELGDEEVAHMTWLRLLRQIGVRGDNPMRQAADYGWARGGDDVTFTDLEQAWLDEILGESA